MSRLIVNEVYGPVRQGEGKSAGEWCAFLRLSACNLSCVFCDSAYTWNWIGTKFKHPDKYDKHKETHQMNSDDVLAELEGIRQTAIIKDGIDFRRVVITGGEPMLQQKQLIPLLEQLKERHWFVEIETNGTIAPLPEFVVLVDQFNCSPKLANSGDPHKARIIVDALRALIHCGKTNFKFVVGSNADIGEIMDIVDDVYPAEMRPKDIYLMPMAKTKIELATASPVVKDLATTYAFNYSPRLHVEEHGDKRAV